MKNMFESGEIFTAYATIDAGYYMIENIQKELDIKENPINSLIDKATGYDKVLIKEKMRSNGILNKIFNEDCLITMSRIESGTVDLILQDPPYGTTANDWDKLPELNTMWKEWNRIIKPNGAIIMTASQPFTTDLIMSNRKDFRYCLVWDKMRSCGSMLCNVMPLKYHEDIVIFYKKKPTYNPQMERGQRLKKASGGNSDNYGSIKIVRKENDQYYPKSILSIKACHNMTGKFHPTEKPIDLMRYLIRTYSNENETVFDGYAGSGSTAHACILEKRNFICSELHEPYFKYAKQRIENERMQTKLF